MNSTIAREILEQTKNNYDRIALEWDRTRQHLWPGMDDFLRLIPDGSNVLDVGCGNARLLKLFDSVKVTYVGIDVSSQLLAIAQKRYPGQTFHVADILDIPAADGFFDAVFAIAVLHHIPSKKFRRQAVLELLRVLKPGGYLVMTNWHYRSPRFLKRFLKTLPYIFFSSRCDLGDIKIPWGAQKQPRFVHLFSNIGLRFLLFRAGFRVVSMRVERPSRRGFYNLVTIAQKRYNKGE